MIEPRANETTLRSTPVGTRIPGSMHSITCSIPTIADIIGYEEKKPETMRAIQSGYPRFVRHALIRRMTTDFGNRHALGDREIFLTPSRSLAEEALAFGRDPDGRLVAEEDCFAIHLANGSPAVGRIKAYMQHVGGGISSRQAEACLLARGLISDAEAEELADPETAETEVRTELGDLFGTTPERVVLASSGMNAFYAVFRAISDHQKTRGRTDWIQLGWLYVDTIEILRKLGGGDYHLLSDVLDLAQLERLLREKGGRIAGIVTELPTNPLIQTPDLLRLRELAIRYDIPLVADPTLASPYNIDVLPHCDVAVNSLTKYAANAGDVMMGAMVFNPASRWTAVVRETVDRWLVRPYSGDVRRLAVEMRVYRDVLDRINANALALTDWLERHPAVEAVFGSYSGESGENYRRLQRRPRSPGGVISMKAKGPVAEFYDRIDLPKGPSFGTVFTILCPFLYLAHYDLVSNEEGKMYLKNHGIDPELVRISVGVEDPEKIISAFARAL